MMLLKVVSVPPNSDMLSKGSHDVCFICGNRGVNQSYHKIPTNSPVREKWLEVLKIKEYSSSIRVCSIHFKKEDYRKLGENNRKILHKSAIPSKLLTVKFGESIFANTMQKCNKKCCVCGAKDASLTYHTFPSEPNLRKQWADACGFKDHLLLRSRQICGKHFKKEDYNYHMKINPKADKTRRTLRKDVLPSLLLGGNLSERKNTIINLPLPYKSLAPKSTNALIVGNMNNVSRMTIPASFASITPVGVNPAVLSSLCVVLGDRNAQVNSSTSTTAQNKSSILKPARTKSPEVVELSDSDSEMNVAKTNAAPTNSKPSGSLKRKSFTSAKPNSVSNTGTNSSVSAETNLSALAKSDSDDSKTHRDQSVLLADDEDSNFSLEELVLEEPLSVDEDEANSNSESNNRPAKRKKATPAVRPSLPTKYRPILPAPSLTVENIKLIETLALKNGLRTDHVYEKKPVKPSPPLLWRYPSDIGVAHCSTPANAWRAVQVLKSTIEKQRVEIRGLQQFKRRTLAKMQKMSEELKALKQKQKVEDLDVEPWWV